jgi:hypothetical protein
MATVIEVEIPDRDDFIGEPVLERGIVASYDHDASMQTGFIRVLDSSGRATDEKLYFRYINGYFLSPGDKEPEFDRFNGYYVDDNPRYMAVPKPGVTVVFYRGRFGSDRHKVDKWAYASSYDRIKKDLDARPLMRVSRKVQDVIAHPDGELDVEELWTGNSHLELSVMFPIETRRPFLGESHRIDALQNISEPGGLYKVCYVIEVFQDGEWTLLRKDPRVELCCVPQSVFKRHARHGKRQPLCVHRMRTDLARLFPE